MPLVFPSQPSNSQRAPLPSRSTVKLRAHSLMYERGGTRAHCLNAVCREAGLTGYQQYIEAQKNGIQYLDEL